MEKIRIRVEEVTVGLPGPAGRYVFSVDHEWTEEIDDALSVERLDDDRIRVGVHIAAPGLFIPEGSEAHAGALERCTTVYQPDLKWTMLPMRLVDIFSLKEGRSVPVVTGLFLVDRDSLEILEEEFRLEAIVPTANLSYAMIEDGLEGDFIPEPGGGQEIRAAAFEDFRRDPRGIPWKVLEEPTPELRSALDELIPFTRRLYLRRQGDRPPFSRRTEYMVKVLPDGEIVIRPRRRNGLAENLVTELMVLMNNRTASRLAEAGLPAVYRTQREIDFGGDVKQRSRADLTVNPREHAGLGAGLYAWTTSPLRRYTDLINQRQLGSLLGGPLPAFRDLSELLIRAKRAEFQAQTADQHQRRMERYWTLKYLAGCGDRPHPVRIHRFPDKVLVVFDGLPLDLAYPPEAVSLPAGPAFFSAEVFDFHGLRLEGRITK